MNSEALRLLDELCVSFDLRHEHTFARGADKLRALLSAQEPTAEHWQEAVEYWTRDGKLIGEWRWVESRARELAKQEAK